MAEDRTEIRIRLPRVPAGLGTNLLGVAGLVSIVVAVGALAAWPWALLAAGVFAVALTMLAQYTGAAPGAAGAAADEPATARPSRIEAEAARIVADSARALAESTRAEPR